MRFLTEFIPNYFNVSLCVFSQIDNCIRFYEFNFMPISICILLSCIKAW
jgi:hypothetical protein